MSRHRFLEHLNEQPSPQALTPEARPGAFALCQAIGGGMAGSWMAQIYEAAFREAQAVVRPSLPERDLAGVWN